jgi:hypothetical protein
MVVIRIIVHIFFTSIDAEDYIAFQLVSLTFGVGSVSGDEQCYDVVIIDDNLVEDNEIFFVTLTSPEPVLLGSILSRATVTISPDLADSKLKHSLNEAVCFKQVALYSQHLLASYSYFYYELMGDYRSISGNSRVISAHIRTAFQLINVAAPIQT